MDPPNLLFLLLLMFASTINAQFPVPHYGSTGNFTANSTYQTTLTTLISSISTTSSSSLSYGFFNASAAISGASQTLYLFGLCRSDLDTKTCLACLDVLASDMRRLCPLQKEALLYSGNCIIRYSDARTGDDVSSVDTYNAARRKLLNGLSAEAARGGSLRKYASGNESAGPDMIYALVQCTPDLTEQQCSDCLAVVTYEIRYCCLRYSGGRYMVPSCLILYGTNNRFFDPVGGPLPPPLPPPSHGKDAMPPPPVGKSNSTRTGIIVVITSISALLVISIVIMFLNVKRKKQPRESVEETGGVGEQRSTPHAANSEGLRQSPTDPEEFQASQLPEEEHDTSTPNLQDYTEAPSSAFTPSEKANASTQTDNFADFRRIMDVLLEMRGQIYALDCEVVHEISMVESLQFDFSIIGAATDNFSTPGSLDKAVLVLSTW
ncbi:cysteine-rich receptor-like protein kinase 29 [Eucalyptus grandis]|uniref:cysteine-rich receptor-like protein kinase 29 n=1 Tax=Eucalyptus grandis TaxID=71139 RepID=UPI00192EEC59|nr:cysteine-rich receptor-like protein kinase 29 [Eucalyptus grandis]